MKLPKEGLTMKKILGSFLLFALLVSAGTIYASGNTGQESENPIQSKRKRSANVEEEKQFLTRHREEQRTSIKKNTNYWRKLKMSIKTKLAMGIATGALAVSMIGGGTYAYFNDVETST